MYRGLVFLHVVSALAFMGAHGVSIAATFRLKAAGTPEEARAVLGFSRASLNAVYLTFALVSLSGLAAGIWGEWWRRGWFWASVVALIAISGMMVPYAVRPFNRARWAAGPPYLGAPPGANRKPQPAAPEANPQELLDAIATLRPWLLSVVALGGVAVLVWLMMFKPF